MILIIYEVIISIAMVLIVKLVKHVYRLCNFNNLQMPDSYVNKIVVQSECWEIRVIYI